MNPRNSIATILIASGIAFGMATPAAAAPDAAPDAQARSERQQERLQMRLDKMANRLEIKASQQAAWQEYAKVRKSLFESRPEPLAKDADAAAITRYRADRAAEHARKLGALADATAKLQGALSPEQAKVLGELSRRGGHFGGPARAGQWQQGHGPSHQPDGHRGPRQGHGPRS